MNLPENSIGSWDELCEQFVANFRGTFERPCTITDLNAVQSGKGRDATQVHPALQSGSQQNPAYQRCRDCCQLFTQGCARPQDA